MALWQASYCILLHMIRWIPSRPTIDNYELDLQLIVPAAAVGHIIGRHGRRVRLLQTSADARIWLLNAPQPPPTPTGANRSRVKIIGNFWQTQVDDGHSVTALYTSHSGHCQYQWLQCKFGGQGTLKNLRPYCKLKGPLSTCSYH